MTIPRFVKNRKKLELVRKKKGPACVVNVAFSSKIIDAHILWLSNFTSRNILYKIFAYMCRNTCAKILTATFL